MGVHSGAFGVVNGLSTVRKWSINDTASNFRFGASNVQLGSARSKGVRSWTGSMEGLGALPAVMPRDSFSFAGFVAPDNDTLTGTGEKLTGTAVVDSLALTFDFSTGNPISWVVNFSGHLALTKSAAQAALTDATDPDVYPPCAGKVEYDTTEQTDIKQAVLTISAMNKKYANTGTIVAGECWTGVKAGPIDFTLAITRESSKIMLNPGVNKLIDIYVDGTDFWSLKWAMLKDNSGLNVDIENGEIISYTENWEMNAWNGSAGEIVQPGEASAWYPF